MKNLAGMMKQAQQMQKNMKKLQDDLEGVEMIGEAGSGMVQVTMSCKHQVNSVKIDPSVIDADDVETLEDLVTVAINDACKKIEEHVTAEMQKVTGGLNMPGLI